MKKIVSSILGLALMANISTALAENGVSEGEILFGQSAAINGPASALGTGMRDGIEAAFKEINDAGGVHGRKLKLITMDDGYEPDKAIENVNTLINEDKVFAHIGAVGTPTSKATAPIACENNVPFVGPFTGAGFLREMDCVVNIRGSYCAEAETWVKHLTEDLGAKNISLLYQDDGFGRVGLDCVNQALDKRGMKLASSGKYKRNTVAIKGAVANIKKGNPDAIVTVGAYKPVAEFIKIARKVNINVPILNISFTGSNALAQELGGKGAEKVVITQVVPFPFDASLPLVGEYQNALKSYDASLNPGFVSLEGYLVGRITIESLKSSGKDLNRNAFLNAFTGTHDLGGVELTYNMPSDNQGKDEIYLTLVNNDGTFTSLNSLKELK